MRPSDEVAVALLEQSMERVETDLYNEAGRLPVLERRVDSLPKEMRRQTILAAASGAMGGAILANLGTGAVAELFKLLAKAVVG